MVDWGKKRRRGEDKNPNTSRTKGDILVMSNLFSIIFKVLSFVETCEKLNISFDLIANKNFKTSQLLLCMVFLYHFQ